MPKNATPNLKHREAAIDLALRIEDAAPVALLELGLGVDVDEALDLVATFGQMESRHNSNRRRYLTRLCQTTHLPGAAFYPARTCSGQWRRLSTNHSSGQVCIFAKNCAGRNPPN